MVSLSLTREAARTFPQQVGQRAGVGALDALGNILAQVVADGNHLALLARLARLAGSLSRSRSMLVRRSMRRKAGERAARGYEYATTMARLRLVRCGVRWSVLGRGQDTLRCSVE